MNSWWTVWLYIKNTTLHVVRRSLQITVLSVDDPQLDVVFQGLYGARFFSCTHYSSGSPKESNLQMSSLVIEGATGCPYNEWSKDRAAQRGARQHHLLRPRQITHARYRHELAILLKQVPSASDYSFKNYRQKRPWRSVWIIAPWVVLVRRYIFLYISHTYMLSLSIAITHATHISWSGPAGNQMHFSAYPEWGNDAVSCWD
jgi:hypothetical protein